MVALDLSLRATAIGWTHDHNGRAGLGCRTVRTDRVNKDRVDHARIHRVLGDVVAAIKCRPHLAVVEGTFIRGGGSDVPLIALREIICHQLWVSKVPYVDVAPATLKVWATGSGATDGDNKVRKSAVLASVIATYGRLVSIAPKDDNQGDVIGLLSMGLAAYGEPLADVPRSHRRALSTPKWPTLATEHGPVVPSV